MVRPHAQRMYCQRNRLQELRIPAPVLHMVHSQLTVCIDQLHPGPHKDLRTVPVDCPVQPPKRTRPVKLVAPINTKVNITSMVARQGLSEGP